jgi:hypothetical protein
MEIIQYIKLRQTISQGPNHIPLQPTQISQAVAIVMGAFEQLCNILNLLQLGFPVQEARSQLHNTCLSLMKVASKSNKHGLDSLVLFFLTSL